MLAPVIWLKDYLEFDFHAKEYAQKMTLGGTKIEGYEYRAKDLKNVVSAKVIEIERHHNSDHLWVCKVDDGENIHTVVTGAQNVRQGSIVPYARSSSVLANGKEILSGDFRGVISEGMLCSGFELGLNSSIIPKNSGDGIYILDEGTPLGADIKGVLGLDDYVIDIELTNNRQDCNCILGIAAETAAVYGKKFTFPNYEFDDENDDISNYLSVQVRDFTLCPRYTARMLKIKKIEPSPMWMQIRLMASGIRPISNVVDVTNFVMLETGQPLHAFDYGKLNGKKIIVQTADEGDTIITLDNIERKLNNDILMIDDAQRHVGVAGVMGAQNSEIDDLTEVVVLESANFDKVNIHSTSKFFGLRSESAAHFEKGISIHLTKYAADRAAALMVEIGAAELIGGVIDIHGELPYPAEVSMDIGWFNQFAGITLDAGEIVRSLDLLGMHPRIQHNAVIVASPKFRQDIEIREDVAEEALRIYGYDKIPLNLVETNTICAPNSSYDMKRRIKTHLSANGGFEILTYAFISPSDIAKMNYSQRDCRNEPVLVVNPLGEDYCVMRTALLPNMLHTLSGNYKHKNNSELLFEISGRYLKNTENQDELPLQTDMLCIGKFHCGFYEIKAVVVQLIKALKLGEYVKFTRTDEPALHPGRSANICINGETIGYLGQIHPSLAKKFDLPEDVCVVEIDADRFAALADQVVIRAQVPAKYPVMHRDLALVADEYVLADEIKETIYASGGEYLISCEAFDEYRHESLGANKKSIAFNLAFRNDSRTLTDEEADTAIRAIITKLDDSLGIKIRI